ncbi:regulatory protein GemA [Brucella anthropi]|uniref:regulatory protein GemA n=1 Tax=Brucella anthropi TaxID=529 RepID=UPI00235DD031|nr:regulatory protein GemA [Brucella anthropi]
MSANLAIKTIHTGFRQLGIADDEDKRAFYERVVGKTSLKAMTSQQHERIIEEQRRQGFKPASNGVRKRLEGRFAAKLQALWIAGWNLGVFDKRTDEALIAFVKRQTKVDHVRLLHDPEDARIAIESLKKWIERKVGPVWTNTPQFWSDAHRIAATQWSLLSQQRSLPEPGSFEAFVQLRLSRDSCEFDIEKLTAQDWHKVMNDLGGIVRRAQASLTAKQPTNHSIA